MARSPIQVGDHERAFQPGIVARLAGLFSDQPGQLVDSPGQRRTPGQQPAAPFGEPEPGPPRSRLASADDGRPHRRLVIHLVIADDLAGSRVQRREAVFPVTGLRLVAVHSLSHRRPLPAAACYRSVRASSPNVQMHLWWLHRRYTGGFSKIEDGGTVTATGAARVSSTQPFPHTRTAQGTTGATLAA